MKKRFFLRDLLSCQEYTNSMWKEVWKLAKMVIISVASSLISSKIVEEIEKKIKKNKDQDGKDNLHS